MPRNLLSAVVITVLVLAAQASGALQSLENRLAEFRFSQITRVPSGGIVLVDIDSKSLDAIGLWPWPRTVHAAIIDALTGFEAAEIAFDIDFSAASTPEADLALEDALRRANGTVTLAVFNQALVAGSASELVHANVPLPRFAQHAWAATVNVRADPDGKVRSFPYGHEVDGVATPSMPAMLGGYVGPLQGEALIDFGIDAGRIDRVPAIDLIRGAVDRSRIEGRKVIVGASAVELRDLFQVPVHGVISGPMLQALSAETILQGRVLRSLGPAVPVAGLCLLALGVLALRRLRWTNTLLALAGSSLIVEAGAFVAQHGWSLQIGTATWHAAAIAFGLAVILREIGFRRILLAISSTETRNTQKILSQVVADNFAGVVVVESDGTIHTASRSAAKILQVVGEDLAGRNARDALPPLLAEAVIEAIDRYRTGLWEEQGPQELRVANAAGAERLLEYVLRPSKLNGGVSRLGATLGDRFIASLTFVDVTERRAAEARLAYLARFDTLTALPNRNQFTEALAALLPRPKAPDEQRAVIFFDLDRFKNINDTLGHRYGDMLLRAVAERVGGIVGETDFAARFGGDEYAMICVRRGDAEVISEFASMLIGRISEPYEIEGHRLIIGVSLGIACLDGTETDPMHVIKNADTALYRAKSAGGNGYRFYDTSMDASLEARRLMEVDLWEAFERNQFEVHYQPQMDLAREEITGVEALVRWRHPERGFISPAEFVPVAEAVGLIEPLGAWVLQQACLAAMRWPKPIKVAVNVSPVQFTRGDLVATVTAALRRSGLPAQRLDLEITESLFINENRAIQDTIDALRARDISFSIDDFGTGYSSLSYIRKFPVQKLKIDRSFISGLPFDRESLAIVRAVTALAQSLEIRINAEGVETPEQMACLQQIGCTEGQGYLFGKAVPADEIARMLRQNEPLQRLSA